MLSGANIDEGTLGQVPSAGNADLLDGKDSGDFVGPGSAGWTPLPFVTFPAFCHYANYGGGGNPAGYYRDPFGIVHLRGMVRAIDGSLDPCGVYGTDPYVSANLPAGYWPANQEVFTISANSKPARVDVVLTGQLFLDTGHSYPTWPDAEQWFSLDGITYRCGPSGQDGCP